MRIAMDTNAFVSGGFLVNLHTRFSQHGKRAEFK